MKSKLLLAVFFVTVLSVTSCYYDKEEVLYPNTKDCDTTKISFQSTIFPIINSSCNLSGCHDATTQASGYNFTTYAGIKAQIEVPRFLGSIKHESSYSSMPKGGGKLSACNILKIEQWKKNGSPNN